ATCVRPGAAAPSSSLERVTAAPRPHRLPVRQSSQLEASLVSWDLISRGTSPCCARHEKSVSTTPLRITARQHASSLRTATDPDPGDLQVLLDLPAPRLAPQLRARLVQEPVTVQSAGGELAAVRIDRQPPVDPVVLLVVQERADLAVLCEAEGLDPLRGQITEPVIEARKVDVPG